MQSGVSDDGEPIRGNIRKSLIFGPAYGLLWGVGIAQLIAFPLMLIFESIFLDGPPVGQTLVQAVVAAALTPVVLALSLLFLPLAYLLALVSLVPPFLLLQGYFNHTRTLYAVAGAVVPVAFYLLWFLGGMKAESIFFVVHLMPHCVISGVAIGIFFFKFMVFPNASGYGFRT